MDPQAEKLVAELEVEMMADMYKRMTNCCHKKCISTNYHQGSLEKGELVCIDRCVAKFIEVHEQIGKRLMQVSQTEEATMNKMMQNPQGSPMG